MDKKRLLWIALDSVFIVIFNIFFFALSNGEKPASVWINYGFIHFAYIVLLVTPKLVRHGAAETDYRRPLYVGTTLYFIATFFVGLVFILVAPETTKASWLVHAALFAIAAVYLLTNMLANEYTADKVKNRANNINYLNEVKTRVKILVDGASNKNLEHKLEALYDAINASPTMSSDAAKTVEQQIVVKIDELENAASSNNEDEQIRLCEEIIKLIKRRNSM